MRRPSLAIAAVCALLWGQPGVAAGLCAPGEAALFECTTRGRRTVSICRVGNGPEPALVYRFGRPGRVELQHPADPRTGGRDFTQHEASWPKGTAAQLGFVRGGVRYTVYSESSSFEGERHGVLVEASGQASRNVACTTQDRAALAEVGRLGLPEHDYRPIP